MSATAGTPLKFAEAKAVIAAARTKAKAIIAAARAHAKSTLASARARARGKSARAPATKSTEANIGPEAHRARFVKAAQARADRVAALSAKEIKRAKPRVPVSQVLRLINSYVLTPGHGNLLRITTIRSQLPTTRARDVDYQITELARVGIVRLLSNDELYRKGFTISEASHGKGYPSNAPKYWALEKLV